MLRVEHIEDMPATSRTTLGMSDDDMPPRLICVEQTHNFGGGAAWSLDEVTAVAKRAHEKGLTCHMDGARLFNASASTLMCLAKASRERCSQCERSRTRPQPRSRTHRSTMSKCEATDVRGGINTAVVCWTSRAIADLDGPLVIDRRGRSLGRRVPTALMDV
jgi:hypothetical protein